MKSPEKVMNCCRNANHASDAQHACVCLTDHCFRKPITERQIQDRNKAIWDNNPLASGSATSHAAFSGYQYFALHAAKIVINFNIATKLQHFLRLFVIKCIATEFYT